VVTSTTVGCELADAVSGDEASCLEEDIGGAAYRYVDAAPTPEAGQRTFTFPSSNGRERVAELGAGKRILPDNAG